MPYAGGENPRVGDTVKHSSGQVGAVFELDNQAEKPAKDEKIKVKFGDGNSVVALASEFTLVKEASE
jgi:hypothetical protein